MPKPFRECRAPWAVLVLWVGCLPSSGSSPPNTAPAGRSPVAALKIFVPQAARHSGAILPVDVQAEMLSSIDAGTDSSAGEGDDSGAAAGTTAAEAKLACVALWAAPGQVRFAFPTPCRPLAPEGGAGDHATPADVVQQCVRLTGSSGRLAGSVVAAYQPMYAETTVTIFGALYGDKDCLGPAMVETAVVVNLAAATPPPDAAPEGGSDRQGSDAGGSDGGPSDAAATTDAVDAPRQNTDGGAPDGGTSNDAGSVDAP